MSSVVLLPPHNQPTYPNYASLMDCVSLAVMIPVILHLTSRMKVCLRLGRQALLQSLSANNILPSNKGMIFENRFFAQTIRVRTHRRNQLSSGYRHHERTCFKQKYNSLSFQPVWCSICVCSKQQLFGIRCRTCSDPQLAQCSQGREGFVGPAYQNGANVVEVLPPTASGRNSIR